MRLALPATLFNHPTCGNLLVLGIDGIVRHLWVLCNKRFVLLTADDGIHEETASIALYLWIWKLGITNIDNNLSQLLGSRFADALTLQFAKDIAIVEMRHKGLREFIDDHRYQKAIFPFLLETALAITILTIMMVNDAKASRSNFYSMYLTDKVLSLSTIGPNILNSTGAHVARNQREVFCAIESHAKALVHHIIERFTTATL